MIKNPFSFIQLGCLFLALSAATSFGETLKEKGFYIGMGVGGSTMKINQTIQVTAIPSSASSFTATDNTGTSYFEEVFFAGYSLTYDRYFLAAEAFLNHQENRHAREMTSATTSASNTLTSTTSLNLEPFKFGLDLRSGIFLEPNLLLYGRIGLVATDATITSTWQITGSSPAGAFVSSAEDEMHPGIRLGLGLEYKLTPRWGLQADYIYTYYGSMNLNRTVQGSSFNNDTILNFDQNSVLLSLNYHFS